MRKLAPTPALRVLNPGLWTTVQDLGRDGLRAFGVPVGGAFDRGAHRLASAMAGNDGGDASLELTLFGGTFEALIPVFVALAGAPMEAWVERARASAEPVVLPRAFALEPGDRLVVRRCARGARSYLAIHGGVQSESILGSRSSERPVRAGDLLFGNAADGRAAWPGADLTSVFDSMPPALREAANAPAAVLNVVAGPDAEESPALEERAFRVAAASNRMGVRFDEVEQSARRTALSDSNRVSSPVCPGAIQLTPAGLIALGVACGTMGGYPHVAHLISADLDRLGQMRSGDTVMFRYVDIAEARRLDDEQRGRRRVAGLTLRTAFRAGISAR